MAWYRCTINEVGPISYNAGQTSIPNVLLNLTDTAGSFANTWFQAPDGTQAAMLAVGLVALTNNKFLEVGADPPTDGSTPAISNLYLLAS
jgi:hypothetical protein